MVVSRRRSLVNRLLLVCVAGGLMLALLPAGVSQAAIAQSTIDNSISEFGRGAFQRTALGPLQNTTVSPKDESGAIQLGPIGLLKQWIDSPFNLNKRLLRMGATALGNRLFVIGGLTPVGNATQSVAEVWSAAVSQTNGTFLEDWQAELPLPAVQGSNQTGFTTPVAPVNSPGVAAVDTGGGGGYLYVVGGNTQPSTSSTFDFSSYAVRIATVGANGRISGWTAGPSIPSPVANDTISQLGLQSPGVRALTVNGKTYIYIVGGLKRYRTGTGFQARTVSEGSKDVFYARVGANGQLVKPSTGAAGWDKLASIPIPGSTPTGIWDAVLLGDHFVASTGDSADVLYVIGGQLTPDDQAATPPSFPSFSSKIYRAFVGTTGALTWDFGWQGTLPQTRTGMSGEAFRGSFYVVGGNPSNGNEPDKGVLTSYVEDNVELHQFNAGEVPPGIDGGGSNFLKSDALRFARVFHATAIVPADSSSPNSAFIYVFGGRGNTTDGNPGDDQGSDTVFYGKIGGGEDTNAGYALSGWYYSKPYDINFTGAQLQKIYWDTVIPRVGADPDILPEYRISSSNSCANADWTDNSWVPIDAIQSDGLHASASGKNTSAAINLAARCFQYRMRLTTDSYLVTPSLLNVSIDIFVPGSPDLKVKVLAAQLTSSKVIQGLNVVIENRNTFETTLAADIDVRGSFFVDVCIFGPGEPVGDLVLPLSNANQGCSDMYADINRSLMPAFGSYSITRWLKSGTGAGHDQPVDLLSFFKSPGTYTLIAAVDSYNNVGEGTLGGEGNNVTKKITFEVGKIGYKISLPMAKR